MGRSFNIVQCEGVLGFRGGSFSKAWGVRPFWHPSAGRFPLLANLLSGHRLHAQQRRLRRSLLKMSSFSMI